MKISPFLAFLDFLAPAGGPSEGLEIPPYLQSERREPPTAGPDGDDLTKRPESASAAALARNSKRSAAASLARALLAEGT
jgi:hypothetical protein